MWSKVERQLCSTLCEKDGWLAKRMGDPDLVINVWICFGDFRDNHRGLGYPPPDIIEYDSGSDCFVNPERFETDFFN